MAVCKQCRWFRPGLADPRRGTCIGARYEAGGEETSSGVQQTVIPATEVMDNRDKCIFDPSRFEPKAAHADRGRLREGI